MKNDQISLRKVRAALLAAEITPRQAAEKSLARVNQNAGHNVYLSLDAEWTLREADRVQQEFANRENPPLFGLPVSLKDCFDLQGFRTTAGARFYADKNEIAREDSAVAKRLRAQGAVITGKTNLHPLAYGITGENRDFGDCLQPAKPNQIGRAQRLNSSHTVISYAVFCLKKKKKNRSMCLIVLYWSIAKFMLDW